MRNKVVVVLLLCFLFGSNAACGQEKQQNFRLIFSPFDVSSAGNYAYLRDGVQSMLVSRLATKDRIEVIDSAVSEKELARLKAGKGKKEGAGQPPIADFLVDGALYGLKSGLNVQVVLYPIATDREILRFSIITNTPNTLIADVEQLAGEIVQTVIGGKAVQSAIPQKPVEAGETSGFVTVHPEAAFKKGLYSGTVVGTPGGAVQATALGGKRQTTIPTEMTGLAVGDADGDGVAEIFVLAGTKLELYKMNGKTIDKIASANLPKTVLAHAINTADLDNDGRPEIYLSATSGLDVASLVMKWNKDNGFVVVSRNIGWYLRPLHVPGKGWRLAGQRRGLEKTELVREGVYLLDIDRQFSLREGERLPLPKRINLFDFVYADLDGDGQPETVCLDQREKLKVFNQAGELLWVSERFFGGSKIYLGPRYGEAVNEQDRRNLSVDEDDGRELIFIPGRMIVADIDHNGRQEIIVNENTMPSLGMFGSSIVGFFSRLKTYKEGAVVGLAWNGQAMQESWRTGKLRGYIADHGFALLNKAAEASSQPVVSGEAKTIGRLFIGQVPNSGSLASLLPGSDDSQLIAYELEFSVEKQSDK